MNSDFSFPLRIIARLDVKGPNLVKGIQFDGLRVVGNPAEAAKKYYEQGIDELLLIDIVASLYGRPQVLDLVRKTAQDARIPLTVGGGIKSVEDAKRLFDCGADRVAVNTNSILRPALLKELSEEFGSQAVVLSVHAKKRKELVWEALTESGRETSGISVLDWIQEAQDIGVGEILVTSVDHDGMRGGFDSELVRSVSEVLHVPFLIGGGFKDANSILEILSVGACDGVVVASQLHYGSSSVEELKSQLAANDVFVRS